MKYVVMTRENITKGLNVIRKAASAPTATSADIAYCKLVEAIIEGEGFNFMTSLKACDLNKSDMRELLKELLYAVENERITDRHTHTDIVTETLDNVFWLSFIGGFRNPTIEPCMFVDEMGANMAHYSKEA